MPTAWMLTLNNRHYKLLSDEMLMGGRGLGYHLPPTADSLPTSPTRFSVNTYEDKDQSGNVFVVYDFVNFEHNP